MQALFYAPALVPDIGVCHGQFSLGTSAGLAGGRAGRDAAVLSSFMLAFSPTTYFSRLTEMKKPFCRSESMTLPMRESTVRYLGSDIDGALEMAEQTAV
jgi:hypothetical protein